jgi:hypothetical protein
MAGVSFSHALQAPTTRLLDGPAFLQLHQVFLSNYGVTMGALECVGLLLLVATAYMVRRDRRALALTTVAAIAVAAMIAVWAVFIQPLNVQVNTWTETTLPADWAVLRDKWQILQLARAALALVAFAAFVDSSLARPEAALSGRTVERMLADAMESTLQSTAGVHRVAWWELRAAAVRRR